MEKKNIENILKDIQQPNYDNWVVKDSPYEEEIEDRDYESELDDIPIEEIEKYLRIKKLDRINKK